MLIFFCWRRWVIVLKYVEEKVVEREGEEEEEGEPVVEELTTMIPDSGCWCAYELNQRSIRKLTRPLWWLKHCTTGSGGQGPLPIQSSVPQSGESTDMQAAKPGKM